MNTSTLVKYIHNSTFLLNKNFDKGKKEEKLEYEKK